MEGQNKLIFFKQDFIIRVNTDNNPLFYAFDYVVRPKNMEMQFQHFHAYYEIYVLLDDHAAHLIEGEYFKLQRNDIVFLKPSVLHMTKYPEDEDPKSRLIIAFKFPSEVVGLERDIQKLLSLFDVPVPIFRFSGKVLDTLTEILNEIFILGSEARSGSSLLIHCKFMEFLWTIYTNRQLNAFKKQEITDSVTQKIYEITSYMHTHFDQDLSLSQIAERFYISSFYLSHQFKRITGITYTEYLQMIRVRNTQQLLLYTNEKIKNISERCGFSSFSQFNRVFNHYCGMSPSSFRLDTDHHSQEMIKSLNPDRNSDTVPSRSMIPIDC
jgi:AraC-like DNA-binding protein